MRGRNTGRRVTAAVVMGPSTAGGRLACTPHSVRRPETRRANGRDATAPLAPRPVFDPRGGVVCHGAKRLCVVGWGAIP